MVDFGAGAAPMLAGDNDDTNNNANEQQSQTSSFVMLSPNPNEDSSPTSVSDNSPQTNTTASNNNNGNYLNVITPPQTQTQQQQQQPVQNVHATVKSDEYSMIDTQLAALETVAVQAQRLMADDEKQLKRQIKQAVKSRNDDDTDTDEYKELSSTTDSNDKSSRAAVTGTGTGRSPQATLYGTQHTPWYRNELILTGIGVLSVGIISLVIYKMYFSQSQTNNNQSFQWLNNHRSNNGRQQSTRVLRHR
mmetsp:Transcript_47760/g.76551  ORF Transcript_47760/g.76551 Transcript_47760/m.76551 type:complete len:248 (+) Transcript_47760:62-805(+)